MNGNLTHIFVQLFRDSLNEYAYTADIAGLKWELTNTKYGLIVRKKERNYHHIIHMHLYYCYSWVSVATVINNMFYWIKSWIN